MTYFRDIDIPVRLRVRSKSAVEADEFQRRLRRALVAIANQQTRARNAKVQIVIPADLRNTYE